MRCDTEEPLTIAYNLVAAAVIGGLLAQASTNGPESSDRVSGNPSLRAVIDARTRPIYDALERPESRRTFLQTTENLLNVPDAVGTEATMVVSPTAGARIVATTWTKLGKYSVEVLPLANRCAALHLRDAHLLRRDEPSRRMAELHGARGLGAPQLFRRAPGNRLRRIAGTSGSAARFGRAPASRNSQSARQSPNVLRGRPCPRCCVPCATCGATCRVRRRLRASTGRLARGHNRHPALGTAPGTRHQAPGTAPGTRHKAPGTGSYLISFSISSITRSIFRIVRSSGSLVVMSTPAPFSRSIGYCDPPDARNAR